MVLKPVFSATSRLRMFASSLSLKILHVSFIVLSLGSLVFAFVAGRVPMLSDLCNSSLELKSSIFLSSTHRILHLFVVLNPFQGWTLLKWSRHSAVHFLRTRLVGNRYCIESIAVANLSFFSSFESSITLSFFLLLPLKHTFYSWFLALLYSSFARSHRFSPFNFDVAATGDNRRAFVIVAIPFC